MSKQKLKLLQFFKPCTQDTEIIAKKNELLNIQEELKSWHEKATNIQAKFDFIIPNYILDEIILKEASANYENLYSLINLAIVNGNLLKENGMVIKNFYCQRA